MPSPVFNRARAAEAIIYATLYGDEKAIAEYEIGLRTLQRYRQRLDNDKLLNRMVTEGVQQILDHRSEEGEKLPDLLQAAIDSILKYMAKAAESGGVNAKMLFALNDSFEKLADYDLSLKLLHARTTEETPSEGAGIRSPASATGPGQVVGIA